MPFLDSLDIANRTCQHCGVVPIQSVTEISKQNIEISAVYDKVRRAELRRNVWRFATRKVMLYSVNTAITSPTTTTPAITCELVPPLYSSTNTYLYGSIVTDTNGLFWISNITENLGNPPGGNNNAWDSYFGSR